MPWIVERITLAEVRAARPEMLFYAAKTTWWTHDRGHLQGLKGNCPIPIDPRGSPLFEARDPEEFFRHVEEAAAEGHYGKHGLRAFMGAHHLNMQYSQESARPWSVETWQEVNDLLDLRDRLRDGQ